MLLRAMLALSIASTRSPCVSERGQTPDATMTLLPGSFSRTPALNSWSMREMCFSSWSSDSYRVREMKLSLPRRVEQTAPPRSVIARAKSRSTSSPVVKP